MDWRAWHGAYDHPDSSLSRRRVVVRRRLAQAAGATGRPATVLSLCAGDGVDVIDTCRDRTTPSPARAVLVEVDPVLATRASIAATDLPMVEVRCADASAPESYADVSPVDILLLCGVFGNVAADSVAEVVARASALVRDDGFLLWTRGGGAPDRRAEVRRAVIAAGFEEIAFDGAPESFGVGLSQLRSRPVVPPTSGPLFTFIR